MSDGIGQGPDFFSDKNADIDALTLDFSYASWRCWCHLCGLAGCLARRWQGREGFVEFLCFYWKITSETTNLWNPLETSYNDGTSFLHELLKLEIPALIFICTYSDVDSFSIGPRTGRDNGQCQHWGLFVLVCSWTLVWRLVLQKVER